METEPSEAVPLNPEETADELLTKAKFTKNKGIFTYWQNAIQQDNYDTIRDDYLSLNYTIEALVEKHGIRLRSLLWYIRNKWKKIIVSRGQTPPKEPKMAVERGRNIFWQDIEVDYRYGLGVKELAVKYKVHPTTIAKRMSKEGWAVSKKALPALGARSQVSPAEFGLRMENFTLSVKAHMERILIVMEKFRKTHRKILNVDQIERIASALANICKSYTTIVETSRKLYDFTVKSYEVETEVVVERKKDSGMRAVDAGMKPMSHKRPGDMAVPIRIKPRVDNGAKPQPQSVQ